MAETTNINQPSETKAALDAGIGLADLEKRIIHVPVGAVDIPVGMAPQNMSMRVLEDVLNAGDERADAPRRLRGTSTHQELDSFIAHVNGFKDSHSVVFADASNVKLTAIYDYNQAACGMTSEHPASVPVPRWGKHRAVYACPLSREWQLWLSKNDKAMGQEEFAQFIEDNMVDLANPVDADIDVMPKPAAVLEMARKLAINIVGEFKREINVTTGESTLVNKTEHGPNSTKICKSFLLGIPVFEAGERWRLEARIRFAFDNGRPRFAYSLYQPEAIKRDAFAEVQRLVKTGTALPVFVGTPEV